MIDDPTNAIELRPNRPSSKATARQARKRSNRYLLERRFPSSLEHLEDFAQRHGLDLGALSGTSCSQASIGRDIRDVYSIHLGKEARCLTDPALTSFRKGGPPILPNPYLPISAVVAIGQMKFGNSIAQISNAVSICDSLGIASLHLPGYWYIKRGRNQTASGLHVRNKKRINLRREQLTLCGRFFYRSTLAPLYSQTPNQHLIMRRLSDLLQLPTHLPPLAVDDLVVHLRSGDVFNAAVPHPHYGQPPLAYYLKILHSRPWRSITMVFQDEGNPVVAALRTAIQELGLPLRCANGSLIDDLAILLSARTLVSGTGTFASGVSALSQYLTTVYSFEKRFNPSGNPHVRMVPLMDQQGSYVKQVMRRNWGNTPEQRHLMLTYPHEAIAFSAGDLSSSGR